MVLDLTRLRRGGDTRSSQQTQESQGSQESSGSGRSSGSSGSSRTDGNASVFELNDAVKGKNSSKKYSSKTEMADALFRDYGVEVSCCTRTSKNDDLLEEMARSYDSVLDLAVDEKLNKFMREHGIAHYETIYEDQTILDQLRKETGLVFTPVEFDLEDTDGLYDDSRIRTAKNEDGKSVEQHVSHRNYMISMVDEDGNVIQDEDGNLAQVLKSDMIVPDGIAQQVELLPSGFLEGLGYDCVSMLDLSPEEYKQVIAMASMKPEELGFSSDYSVMDAVSTWAEGTYTAVDRTKGHASGQERGLAKWAQEGMTYEEYREKNKTGFRGGYWNGNGGSTQMGGNGDGTGAVDADGNPILGSDESSDSPGDKKAVSQYQFDAMVQTEVDKGATESDAQRRVSQSYEVK